MLVIVLVVLAEIYTGWLLGWLLLWLVAVVVLALAGSLIAKGAKQAALSDASFTLAVVLGWPVTLALHLLSPYYMLGPDWLEPAFHRWRVQRYFVSGGPHTASRLLEAAQSDRPYHATELPPPGRIVRWDFRGDSRSKTRAPAGPSATLRVVTWNLEFGYLLGPIIAQLRELQPDVVCLQEVDVHSDPSQRVSVDVGREIARALGMSGVWAGHHRYTSGHLQNAYDGGTWGCAVLSRFDLQDTPAFLELPFLDGYPRGAVMAAVDCGGTPLKVISMHTEVCCSPEVRLSQLADVCNHPFVKADRGAATIIAGDMNTIGGQFLMRLSPIHSLTAPPWLAQWRDGWLAALFGKPTTEAEWWQTSALADAAPGFVDADHPRLRRTLGFSWPLDVREKLDWMLLRGLHVVGTDGCSVGTGTESDHRYICADLALTASITGSQ